MPAAAKTEKEFLERFWRRVDKTRDCWVWIGARSGGGYGQIGRDRLVHYVHRLSWTIHFGEVPDGLLVCHTCDNRVCVRPEHLFLGRKQDNNQDCASKFRGNGRKNSPVARLDDDEVLEIRAVYRAGGISQHALAARYDVAQMTISKIVRGETWKRLPV
jgi:hypothetical protein